MSEKMKCDRQTLRYCEAKYGESTSEYIYCLGQVAGICDREYDRASAAFYAALVIFAVMLLAGAGVLIISWAT